MNNNHLCVFDLETSSASVNNTQILEIGAVMVNCRNLEIVDQFQSLLKPTNFDTVEDGALKVNKLTVPQLEKAPETKVVWHKFVEWVNKYNTSKTNLSTYNAPVPCGYNIVGFDLPIIRRYCCEYGPWDDKREDQKLFNQVYHIDLMHQMWAWFENEIEITNLKLATLTQYMGFNAEDIEKSHQALTDVVFTAQIIIRLLKWQRAVMLKKPFKNSFKDFDLKSAMGNIVR
jgi:DNA polymerase III epsilon subunit-like protein